MQSLEIPSSHSAEQAERAARAAYYAPRGERSIGATRARLMVPDYLATANDSVSCIVMIESPRGVEAVREIADTPVSGLFVGLADLMHVQGKHGISPLDDPQTLRWLELVLATCVERELNCGVFTENTSMAVQLEKMGFDLIGVTLDSSLLIQGFRSKIADLDSFRISAEEALK